MEVEPGSVWEFIMHGPDGTDYKNNIIYVEVIKPELLIYDHVSGPKFRVTVKFEEQESKTKLSMQMLFDTVKERDRTVETFNAIDGLNQTIGHLEEYLKRI